jgi:pimeloyl-ACP methyl ester carboxylesterase
MTGKPAFLFVHGAWHNASTWAYVTPILEAQGFRTRVIDLPGAGANAKAPRSFSVRPLDAGAFASEPSPNAAVTQAERTAAVVAEIEALKAPVVLVGHSLGGLTVSAAAEAVPQKLHAAVYLTAFLLPPGMPAIAMIQHETMARALVPSLLRADPVAVGALRIDVASPDSAYRASLRECFYGDVAEAEFDAFALSLHCDEPVGVCLEPSSISTERFGTVRRGYIRCAMDRAITTEGQDFMIAATDGAIGGASEVATLATSHSAFLSQPEALAALLLKFAD